MATAVNTCALCKNIKIISVLVLKHNNFMNLSQWFNPSRTIQKLKIADIIFLYTSLIMMPELESGPSPNPDFYYFLHKAASHTVDAAVLYLLHKKLVTPKQYD